ncbi:MAG: MBL fold metallo-hydrolase [Longimicrobiales bacterium]
MKRRAWAILLAPALLSACLRTSAPGVSGLVASADPAAATGDPADALRAVYLGSGGWILQYGGDMVLTGPLFTNPGLLTTGLLPIRSDSALVDRYMSRYDVSGARAILVGHAHYDHLMDVPGVARRHAPSARIVGSRTVANTLGTWAGLEGRVDVVDEGAADQETVGRWHAYGDRVRVMALRSHHAPHFDGYTLYRGTRDTPRTEEPAWATDWVDGETYAFLIDFMATSSSGADSIAFRVYYQDAVSPAPAGFAPDALMAERPVDVAILVPATFDQVDWHPEAFVENLRPRYVLLGHWEDFFSPMDAPTRSMRLTDIRHFERRLERVFDGQWWRPDRWTELHLH